jgi:hypothetical protein
VRGEAALEVGRAALAELGRSPSASVALERGR